MTQICIFTEFHVLLQLLTQYCRVRINLLSDGDWPTILVLDLNLEIISLHNTVGAVSLVKESFAVKRSVMGVPVHFTCSLR